VDLAPHDSDQRRRRALEGHVQELRARQLRKALHAQVHRTGQSGAAVGERHLLRIRNEVFQVLDREVRLDDQHVGLRGRVDDRLKNLEHIERNALHDAEQQERIGVVEKRITVGSGPRHQLGRNDAASPGAIVDDDRLPEVLAQHLASRARDRIAARTGRRSHDEPYRPRGVVRRLVLRHGYRSGHERAGCDPP
jgi:hypothetical protein